MKNFNEVNNYLSQFMPGSILDGDFYNPQKMLELLPLAGSPENNLKIIHVAGTSGKTSTCYYVAALLHSAGAKVGLSVSPHVFEINERVQIDGVAINEDDFCKLFSDFVNIPGLVESKPTYFELLVTFSFWCFSRLGCDYAVIEVGLGGLKDATNVIEDPDKVAVITDIGLDHTRILGDSIAKIAQQKAGIIKPHNHVFAYIQDEPIKTVIRENAKKSHAILHNFHQDDLSEKSELTSHLPLYQQRNWLLANEVTRFLIERDGLHNLTKHGLLETQKILIPSRMQMVKINGNDVILDGAHNPQKLRAFCESVKKEYPNRKIKALIAFSQAKQETLHESLEVLSDITSNIIVTEFSMNMDLPHKAVPAEDLVIIATETGINKIQTEKDHHKALDLLLGEDDNVDLRLVVGSFYLISSLSDKLMTKT